MLIPQIQVQSEDMAMSKYPFQKNLSTITINESVDVTNEQAFIDAVALSLKPIKKLTDIPTSWLVLKYTQMPTGIYPKTINFYPKEIKADKLPYTVVQVGEKMFVVKPDMWFEVDDMYVDDKAFYVKVVSNTMFGDVIKTTSKTKEDELGEYLWKLYSQGEDGRYLWSTVKEIPKNAQKVFLEEFNKLNK